MHTLFQERQRSRENVTMKKKSNNKEGRGNMERVEGKNRMEPFECKAGEGSETAV